MAHELYDLAIAAAQKDGWVLECESPLELRHPESGSFGSGLAAQAVLDEYATAVEVDPEIRLKNAWLQLLRLQERANRIVNRDFDWALKYNLIFGANIYETVIGLFAELGHTFEYYDPDGSEEEDVQAFVLAFNASVDRLKPAMVDL